MKIKITTIFLVLILTIASTIRLFNITTNPPGFHRDEAFFGYEAYSILKTARDQHGKFLPISFEGFGIYDYPLAIYLRVPFIILFGLNILSVRIAVAFYSVITILLIYLISKKMFDDKTALIAATFACFSTWHFFMSRTGYSISMFALMFLLAGVYFIFFGKDRMHKIIGGVLLSLTCFTYAAYYFFLPLFLVLTFAVFKKDILKDKDKLISILFTFSLMVLAFLIFWGANLKRAPQSAFFKTDRGLIFEWSDKPVGEYLSQGKKFNLSEKILHNPRLAYVNKAAQNYFDGFSQTYWLKTGAGFESNVQGFGNLLLYEPLLITVGAMFLLWQRSKWGLYLICWILLGPIASTFTKDVASTRLLHMVAPIILLESAAIKNILDLILKIKNKLSKITLLLTLFTPILFLNFLYYDSYFNHLPAYAPKFWYKGYLDVVDLTNKYPDKNVYLKGKGDLAYVFFLFQNKYNPKKFQNEAVRETTGLNINTVSKFDRYNFVDDIKKEDLCQDYNSIYISKMMSEKDLIFEPDGTIKSTGSDPFIYFIPTQQKCSKLQAGQ